MEPLTLASRIYQPVRLLGKGKGGYSYLVTDGTSLYVLKQLHHEPCDYYQFGDKFAAETDAYARLSALGIPMPRLLDADRARERILKEYIEGDTIAERKQKGLPLEPWRAQVEQMCRLLYPAGLNIDYYPTNFIPSNGKLLYIDYEYSPYSDEWNFENWGSRYW